MVKRYAMVIGGVVDNICLWDGDTATWQPPQGTTMVCVEDVPCDMGWTWDGKTFSKPVAP